MSTFDTNILVYAVDSDAFSLITPPMKLDLDRSKGATTT